MKNSKDKGFLKAFEGQPRTPTSNYQEFYEKQNITQKRGKLFLKSNTKLKDMNFLLKGPPSTQH